MSALNFNTPFNPTRTTHYRFINLTGQRFTRLLVFGLYANRSATNRGCLWLCRCNCGKWRVVPAGELRSLHTKSCGCWSHDQNRLRKTHGESPAGDNPTAEYRAYRNAFTRCKNPKNKRWANYGGRGIEFRFQNYEDFLTCVGRRPTPKHSLDRINNNGHYEPGNVRWATMKEQVQNRTVSRLLTFQGKTMCITEWARHLHINRNTLANRLDVQKWSVEKTLSTPSRTKVWNPKH